MRPTSRSAAFLCAMMLTPALAIGQDSTPDVATVRAATRSTILTNCAASFTDSGLKRALQQARDLNRGETTEEDLRRIAHSARMQGAIESLCRCVYAETLARVEKATSVPELTSISDLIDWTALYKSMEDQHCLATLKKPGAVPPRPRPTTPNWSKVGTWPDGDGYVDASSVHWLAPDKAQAWIRAVFTAPKTAPNGKSFISMQVLETFDCRDGSLKSVSYSGYSDANGESEVYAGDRPDDETPVEKVDTGSRQGVARDWVCARQAR